MATQGGFVQGVYTDNPGSPSTVALPATVRKGNLLVAIFGRATDSTPVVSDSNAEKWAVARSHYDAGQNYRVDIWTAVATVGGRVSSITITAAGGTAEAIRAEYQGRLAQGALDAVNSAIGLSASAASGAGTPRGAGALALGGIGCATGTSITSTGGFTKDVDGTPDTTVNLALQSLTQSVLAAIDATATLSGSVNWSALLATFILAPVDVDYVKFPRRKPTAMRRLVA